MPLIEGEMPPVKRLVEKDGQMLMEEYYPKFDPKWKDPEIYDAENFSQEDKDEFYDYVIRCHACSTELIAYDKNGNRVNNFCPCCGKKLK